MMSRVGNRIREVREKSKMTQRQLAESVGVSQAAISQIETGANSITLERLAQIAAALNKDVASFL